jgi:hypothetical protein
MALVKYWHGENNKGCFHGKVCTAKIPVLMMPIERMISSSYKY